MDVCITTYLCHLLHGVENVEPARRDLLQLETHDGEGERDGPEPDHLVVGQAVEEVACENCEVPRRRHVHDTLQQLGVVTQQQRVDLQTHQVTRGSTTG